MLSFLSKIRRTNTRHSVIFWHWCTSQKSIQKILSKQLCIWLKPLCSVILCTGVSMKKTILRNVVLPSDKLIGFSTTLPIDPLVSHHWNYLPIPRRVLTAIYTLICGVTQSISFSQRHKMNIRFQITNIDCVLTNFQDSVIHIFSCGKYLSPTNWLCLTSWTLLLKKDWSRNLLRIYSILIAFQVLILLQYIGTKWCVVLSVLRATKDI